MNKQINSCGTCRACCIYLNISKSEDEEETKKIKKWITNGTEEKPPGVPCPQVNKNNFKFGCNIHDEPTKPKLCTNYLCGYAIGILEKDSKLRPDNLGIIINVNDSKIITINEISNRAMDGSLAKKTIYSLLEKINKFEEEGWEVQIFPAVLMNKKENAVKIPLSKLKIENKYK